MEFFLLLKARVKVQVGNTVKSLCAKKSGTDAIETASKRAIQNTEEATGDLIINMITDKITKVSRTLSQNTLETVPGKTEDIECDVKKQESSTSPEKRNQIIDKLRLI